MTRNERRQAERDQQKLKEYIAAFRSICFFDEQEMDWNIISEIEYQALKTKWISYCKKRGLSEEYSRAFHIDCMLMKTDLILKVKYKCNADRDDIIKLLKLGTSPLQIADKLYNSKLVTADESSR